MRFALCILHVAVCILPLSAMMSAGYAQAEEAVSISGTLLMLDDETPHMACVVQAVPVTAAHGERTPESTSTTLSDRWGRYQFVNLPSGRYRIRCYNGSDYVYWSLAQSGQTPQAWRTENQHLSTDAASAAKQGILKVEAARGLRQIDFRIPPFKKGQWKAFAVADGMADKTVQSI